MFISLLLIFGYILGDIMNRKKVYLNWIEKSILYLKSFQDKSKIKGNLFYNYPIKINYINARWQEAAFTFAWFYNKTKINEYKLRSEIAINYWCKIQNKNGYFSEYCKFDKSFSATAFSLLSVLLSLKYINLNPKWIKHIKKAAKWLSQNNEIVLTNQQAVASVALLLYAKQFNRKYIKFAEKKIINVLKNQRQGYYSENYGKDFSYSTLTLEMLGLYYINTNNKKLKRQILISVKQFLKTAQMGHYKHIRKTNWAILDGFEIFFKEFDEIKEIMPKLVDRLDIYHLNDERHLCTDTYRFCLAYDNAQKYLNQDFGISNIKPTIPQKNKLKSSIYQKYIINKLRIIGLHNIRSLRRLKIW